MARIDDRLAEALRSLPPKPADDAKQSAKKRYSEQVSEAVAFVFAGELRERGLKGARPIAAEFRPADDDEDEDDGSGAERRMAGGIGAKKVDVTWATEESGLLLGISIKSINFRDRRTKNFQKNLVNRRGDMLFEAVTLHRRFPYAVLAGFFFLDKEAEKDGTARRQSTFANAHRRLKLFAGRNDPAGRDEQYERLYVLLLDASPKHAAVQAFAVGDPQRAVPLAGIFDDLTKLAAERNPDFYHAANGKLETT